LTTPARSIVLVRPHNPSNIGSVARVAKNFGLRGFAVVEPAALPDPDSARLAVGAADLLGAITRHASLEAAVAEFPVVVTTSSLRGRGRARLLELAELPVFLAEAGRVPAAFVFGPERSGLTEDELARASACLRLPTDPSFPTMNLSHAVALVLGVATAFTPTEGDIADPPEPWAPAAEIESAIAHWDRALDAIAFYDTGHRERSLRDWRRLVAGRPMTMREVAILRGVANRVLVTLRRNAAAPDGD
jgi:TrmH family RNA methyltransferase